MKLKIRLCLIVTSIMIVCMTVVSLIILRRVTKTEVEAAITNTESLTEKYAEEIRRHLEGHMDTARVLSQMMSAYDTTEPNMRRLLFNRNLNNLIDSNPLYTDVFAVWKPNALDGLDEQYANTKGTDHTGQFIPWYTRTSAGFELRAYPYYEDLLANEKGRETFSNPVSKIVMGEELLLVTITVPIFSDDGEILGTTGITVDLSPLQGIVEKIKPYDTGVAGVFSNNGVVVSHFDLSRKGKNMRETDQAFLEDKLPMVAAAIEHGEELTFRTYSYSLKSEVYAIYRPIQIGGTTTPWSIMVAIPLKEVMAPVYALIWFTAIIVLSAIAIIALVFVYVVHRITKPIVRMSLMLKDISEGEGDLTRQITVNSKDEIGDMAHFFNLTLEKIKQMVIKVKQKTGTLMNVGNELSTNMTETTSSVNQITSNIQNIKGQIISQSASINETSSTLEQIIHNINLLNEIIETQAASVTESSSAVEEMLANINSVTQTLTANTNNIKNLTRASETGKQSLNEVVSDIQAIARESEGLTEINAVIEDIAAQTNLLSVNAAIEAAHAGEAGKGFAVVADEIRELAESSGRQSKIISAVLQKIKDSIDKITKSTDGMLNHFENISSGVQIVSEQDENILNAMKEQGAGSQQILAAIAQLNEVTQKVRNGSLEMMQGSKEIIQTTATIGSAAQELSDDISEMATGADQIHLTVNRVQTISEENKESIDTLVQEVSLFKVE
ncbi:MAG: methyl-accepting chemotaxis protein [Treponema sp.]|jgi:methyl-accepting chemotaxis protein|nr:methyl-accepting chemotaxis protein [Treponema sp.]